MVYLLEWGITITYTLCIYSYIHTYLQSCLTLCNSLDYSPPGSSVHGILQEKILEWVVIPFSSGSSWPQGWNPCLVQFNSVKLLSHVWFFSTPWTAACQASLSITNSWSLPKFMSMESVMPSNQPILGHPLLLLPSIFPSIRVFSNESVLHIRWPKYWSLSFNISPSNEHPGLVSFRMIG